MICALYYLVAWLSAVKGAFYLTEWDKSDDYSFKIYHDSEIGLQCDGHGGLIKLEIKGDKLEIAPMPPHTLLLIFAEGQLVYPLPCQHEHPVGEAYPLTEGLKLCLVSFKQAIPAALKNRILVLEDRLTMDEFNGDLSNNFSMMEAKITKNRALLRLHSRSIVVGFGLIFVIMFFLGIVATALAIFIKTMNKSGPEMPGDYLLLRCRINNSLVWSSNQNVPVDLIDDLIRACYQLNDTVHCISERSQYRSGLSDCNYTAAKL